MTKTEARAKAIMVCSNIIDDGLKGVIDNRPFQDIAASTTKTLTEFIEELIESMPEENTQ